MMPSLPSNLKLLPGVMTFATGKQFVYGEYPSGKRVLVPYEETGAPKGYTIPEPLPQPAPVRKPLTTTNSKGERVPVRFVPKRLHVVELRRRGEAKIIKEVAENGSNGLAALLDTNLCRWDGKAWHPIFPSVDDYHVQYHLDSKEPADAQSF